MVSVTKTRADYLDPAKDIATDRADWRFRLATNAKRLRTASGMGLREFARYTGLSYQSYVRVEQGRGCAVDNLQTLKTALKVTWDELLEIDECVHQWEPYVDGLKKCPLCKSLGEEIVYELNRDERIAQCTS